MHIIMLKYRLKENIHGMLKRRRAARTADCFTACRKVTAPHGEAGAARKKEVIFQSMIFLIAGTFTRMPAAIEVIRSSGSMY